MSRMSREFTLVLLGSGILSAGYFAAPEPAQAMDEVAQQQAAHRVGGNTYRSHGYMPLIWVHSPMYSGHSSGRPVGATAGISRGGIGAMGHSVGAGGGA